MILRWHYMGQHRVTVSSNQGGLRPTPTWSHVGTICGYTGSLSSVPKAGCAPPRHGPTLALYGTTQGLCLQYPGWVAPHPGMVPRSHYMGQHRVTVYSTQGGLRPYPAWSHVGTIWDNTGSLSTVPGIVAPHPDMVPRWHLMGLHRVTVYSTQGGLRPTPAWSHVGTIWDYTGSLSPVPRAGCAPPRHGPALALYGTTQGHCLQYPGRVAPHPGIVQCWHHMGLHMVTVYGTQGGLRPTPA